MVARFGLHIGNSSACLAVFKDEDRVEVVANDAGDRITPTILQWTPSCCTIGKTAQLELFRNSSNTIIRNKQLLNTSISEVELRHLRERIPYKINQTGTDFKYELQYDGKQYHLSPKDVALWIFKKLVSIAQSVSGGSKDISVVLSVPLYYNSKSIQLISLVAKKAGFNILQIVDEPATAALGCGLGLDSNELPYYCIVYRVGGVSIDATILLVQDGMFSVIESVHKHEVGGVLLTEKLSEYLANEFKRQYRTADISERGRYKLLSAAETAKQILSIQNVAQCSSESIGSGYDLNCSVSRARFENIIASVIPEMMEPLTEVLKKANLSAEKISKVVMCGGVLKTPKLQETVRKMLPLSEIINSSPDEIIAVGAAKQAGYLVGFSQIPDSLAVDIPSLSASLFVTVNQDDEKEVIHLVHENTAVPFRKRFDLISKSQNLVVGLRDENNKSFGSVSVNKVDPSTSIVITLDVYKDSKVLLTVLNIANGEKTYLKCDLNEIKKI